MEQLAQLGPLCLAVIIAHETSGAFELNDCGIERAVLMVRRAEPAQARAWLVLGRFVDSGSQARLADTGLARDQHDPAFARLCLFPAAKQ